MVTIQKLAVYISQTGQSPINKKHIPLCKQATLG